MKTAIIKTEFWENDEIAELNSDTRSVYLCLLTNPKRNTTPVFQLSDRLLSFYTGYNLDVIKICKKQLIEKKYICCLRNYYVLLGEGYVKAMKGNLTGEIEKNYFSALPVDVKNMLKNKHICTGVTPVRPQVYNNIDNNNNIKDNNNNKDNNKDKIEQEKKNKDLFSLFWEEYPKKLNKFSAIKSFEKLKPNKNLFGVIIESIKKSKKTKEWKKENGQFIPYPSTWLNNKRWEDEALKNEGNWR